jgi:two-component system response regulator RegA
MSPPPDIARSVLIVDDEQAFAERLAKALSDRGFEPRCAFSAEHALSIAELEPPELALVDLRLPRQSGLVVVRRLRALDPTTRIVVLTGYGSIATALDAVRSGACHYLTKPASVEEILNAFAHDGAPTLEPPLTEVPSLDRVEWEHIDRVMVACGGNITQAAAALGLHRRSLQRKLGKRPSIR